MRCKPGDMALIIGGQAGAVDHIGKVVQVDCLLYVLGRPGWKCYPQLTSTTSGKLLLWANAHLLPLRDDQPPKRDQQHDELPQEVAA